ncbi:hypothetical protein AVEN_58920-1 [Araneus ventricosus]|uniref:Uncharacterized protein n=1 Tax=Araneus ventricosus TaxID=182803 RepID=A0A4Y2ET74_ARAVE|nr:hypothetical protein AVEN_58920-1 [Araneus ventricosus]
MDNERTPPMAATFENRICIHNRRFRRLKGGPGPPFHTRHLFTSPITKHCDWERLLWQARQWPRFVWATRDLSRRPIGHNGLCDRPIQGPATLSVVRIIENERILFHYVTK